MDLDEMARAATTIQAGILAELRYRPTPPKSTDAEPAFVWSRHPEEYESHSEFYESVDAAAWIVVAYESRKRYGHERENAYCFSEKQSHKPQQARGPDVDKE